jgi:hypothetical protein
MVGAVMRRSGTARAAASIAMFCRRSRGRKEAVPGNQRIAQVEVGCVERRSEIVSQIALQASALS